MHMLHTATNGAKQNQCKNDACGINTTNKWARVRITISTHTDLGILGGKHVTKFTLKTRVLSIVSIGSIGSMRGDIIQLWTTAAKI